MGQTSTGNQEMPEAPDSAEGITSLKKEFNRRGRISYDVFGIGKSFLNVLDTQKVAPWQAPSPEVSKELGTKITALINDYVHRHSGGPRKSYNGPIAVANFTCPERFGNFIHRFLALFTFALVADIPLIDEGTGCDSMVERRAWVNRVEPLSSHRRGRTRRAVVDVLPGPADKNLEVRLACLSEEFTGAALGAVDVVVESNKNFARYDSQEIAALGLPRKARPSRAQTLFALGPHFAIGSLFDAAFSFTQNDITEPVHRDLRAEGIVTSATGRLTSTNSFWLAVHIRHRCNSHKGSESVPVFGRAIKEMLSQRTTASCAVLVASDRRKTVDLLRDHIRGEGCTLVTLSRNKTQRSRLSENGLDAGDGAIRDVYMLSLADSLVASFGSTFSVIAQEILASRSTSRPSALPTIKMCDYEVGACLPVRPLVSTAPEDWWHFSLRRWPKANVHTPSTLRC